MKSSPFMRVLMAAGLYVLLMWGYLILQSPQIYAVYTALIMSIALLFWVGEARVDEARVDNESEFLHGNDAPMQPLHITSASLGVIEPTLDVSIQRLESLKAELTQQYAQFGQDQSLINSRGLGTWHPDSMRGRCGK